MVPLSGGYFASIDSRTETRALAVYSSRLSNTFYAYSLTPVAGTSKAELTKKGSLTCRSST